MDHAIVRQLMYKMSICIKITVTFRYTMQSNHQYIIGKMYDNIDDNIYMHSVIAL